MAYQIMEDWIMREYAIMHAIKELQKCQETFTLHDLSFEARCHRNTAQKSIAQLMRIGLVRRLGNKRNGYRYEVIRNGE